MVHALYMIWIGELHPRICMYIYIYEYIYTYMYGLYGSLFSCFLTGSGCLPEGAYASVLRCPIFRHCDHYVRALISFRSLCTEHRDGEDTADASSLTPNMISTLSRER